VTRRSVKTAAMVAVAALGLSACTIPSALSETRATLGGDQYLQVHFQVRLKDATPGSAKLIKVLQALTFEMNEQSTTGKPIENSINAVDQELVVVDGQQKVLTLVDVKSNLYLKVNFASLTSVPGLSVGSAAAELAALNVLLGSRWIEVPFSLTSQYSSTSLHTKLTQSTVATDENLLTNVVVSLLASGSATTAKNTTTVTGSLASLESILKAFLPKTGTSGITVPTTPGTYSVTVKSAETRATVANVVVTVPNATYGNIIVTAVASFAHQGVKVGAPANPLVITPALIKQFGFGSASSFVTTTNWSGISSAG
jgi:hypothetical protein